MSAVAVGSIAPVRVPGPRQPQRRLRRVPAQPGPIEPLDLGNPLRLTKSMRNRLRAAVRALVDHPSLSSASNAARLGAVVLTAKAHVRGEYRTHTWAAELGRWLGVSRSAVAHTVLPQLRDAGILESTVVTDQYGHPTGLNCRVVPLYQAQEAGDRRNALALSRMELAVLLRLVEALFGPGWTPKGRDPIPAGLLAKRTGRAAATDRLALLLMVLSTGEAGWLQLCPGTVDPERGRPAATVARLLGCSPAAGAQVLSRLQAHGAVEVVRRETVSRLNNRTRVRLVPVALARKASHRTAVPDLAATAHGDLGAPVTLETPVIPGDSCDSSPELPQIPDLGGSAQLHALHAPVVDEVEDGADDDRFSGEGRREFSNRPGRTYGPENQAGANGAEPHLTVINGAGSPLRRGKPTNAPTIHTKQVRGHHMPTCQEWPTSVRARENQSHREVPSPPEALQAVLAPARMLWARLDRPYSRRRVESAVRTELAAAARIVGEEHARAVLTERLQRRLAQTQGGPAAVIDPMAWLTHRGLPRRPGCGDMRCDEGLRMDTHEPCAGCGNLVADRRALRRQVADKVTADMPTVPHQRRRAAYEQQLRQTVNQMLVDAQARSHQAAAQRALRSEAAAQQRAEAEEAEQARQAEPCADCGKPEAAGHCEPCRNRRTAEELISKATLTAAAAGADSSQRRDAAAAFARTESTIRAELDQVLAEAKEHGATNDTLALMARLAMENAADAHHHSALNTLARTEAATAEAQQAYEATMRSAHRFATRSAAQRAATEAAEQARQRTAQHLLKARTTELLATRPVQPKPIDVPHGAWHCVDCGRASRRTRPDSGQCLSCEQRRLNTVNREGACA